jgi:hypothetical protein
MLPLAVEILLKLRRTPRGTRSSKRTLASQLHSRGYLTLKETPPAPLSSTTSTWSRSRPSLKAATVTESPSWPVMFTSPDTLRTLTLSPALRR